MRLVKVVTRTRSSRSTRVLISPRRSSIWPLVGFTMTSGSISPVGRIICWTNPSALPSSYLPGVAER
ncbi:hypothetical protein AHiyo8_62420 [Arthrobacter sp. Hiyo8]|nr:hypothetical protein AHiyo8_62420 [Arthrobacter sp. Hiyo8]